MNKLVIVAAAAVCCCTVVAQENVKVIKPNTVDPSAADADGKTIKKPNARDQWLKATGGKVLKPNSAKGNVVFVDYGNFFSEDDYSKVLAQFFKDAMRYDYSLVRESGAVDFPEIKAKLGASVLVGFYSDDKAPVMLAAPEDGWAAINVPKLMKGLDTEGAKTKFAGSRLRKEAMRAFAYACGCGGTGFPNNTLAVATVQDLDYVKEFIPYDAIQNILKFTKQRGMTPMLQTTYRTACQEGWAHQPTNEIEKAVWDKAHTLPANPIQIKYDPKRDAGK